MDERTLGAIVFLILLAVCLVGLVWFSGQAKRLDGGRRQSSILGGDGRVIGTQV